MSALIKEFDEAVVETLLLLPERLRPLLDNDSFWREVASRELSCVPGVGVISFVKPGDESQTTKLVRFPLQLDDVVFCELFFDVTDVAAFSPYKESVRSFCFLMAVMLSELRLSQNNEQLKRMLAEQKRQESHVRQSQRMEAIGLMAGGLAHDFNNILSAILGYAEMAAESLSDWSLGKYQVDEIIKAGARAKGLVKQILAFSCKSDEKREYLQCQPLVCEVLNLLRATLPPSIVVRQNIDERAGVILADAAQIHQAIMNICMNAAQEMDEIGGELTVSLSRVKLDEEALLNEPDLAPGMYVKLSIADSGLGIDEAIVERIFDPYFTTKPEGEGAGMGLAVVYGIVKGHDGMISVKSGVGEGAVFDIYFPEVKSGMDVSFSGSPPEGVKGSERVLVVDDEESIADLTRWRLESMGYEVYATTSSRDALEMFRAEPDFFDLVITDQIMPQLTGVQLATEMLKIRPRIPVILCSGYSAHVDDNVTRRAGIRFFLMKPIERSELTKAINQALGHTT